MIEFKTIVLCADDFGLNPGVSQGILKLVRMQRLSAVSCMVNMPDFALHAKDLLALQSQVQTGLHFNLTEGYLLSKPDKHCCSLNELLIKTHLRLIPSSFIAKEFNAQLDHYIKIMGDLPDFIDGHQHIHQFPVVRQVILELYEQRLRTNRTFIRSTYPAITLPQYQFKTRILAVTGGRTLSSKLTELGIPHNQYFSGIYDFAPDPNYRDLFRQWLSLAPSNTLIMCHPGEGRINTDVITQTRLLEMEYFLSDEFLNDCHEYQTHLATGPKF